MTLRLVSLIDLAVIFAALIAYLIFFSLNFDLERISQRQKEREESTTIESQQRRHTRNIFIIVAFMGVLFGSLCSLVISHYISNRYPNEIPESIKIATQIFHDSSTLLFLGLSTQILPEFKSIQIFKSTKSHITMSGIVMFITFFGANIYMDIVAH